MKKVLLGTIGFAALGMSGLAFAADLPQREYAKAPVAVAAPIYDWTGFYIGGDGGYGSSRSCWGNVQAGNVVVPDGCHSQSGGVVGGQLGYRWQAGQFVFGLEGGGDWASLRSSHVGVVNPLFTDKSKVTGLGLFTGQVGYAVNAVLF